MYFLRSIPPSPANNDFIILLVPLQNGTRTNAKSLPNLGRDGDLPLGGKLGFSDAHALTLPR